ncbi:MAG: NPCBM/NEW2 domain-containing protein, partial [Pirellulaceae bacterium]
NPSSTHDALGVLRDGQWRWVEGRLGAIERDQVEFAVEDKSAFVKRDRFEGVMFTASDAISPSSRVASVLLNDGSRFNAAKLRTQGGGVAVENLHGAQIEFKREVVNEIDFSNDRWVWLSDLKPTTLDWQPLFASENIAEKLRALSMPRFNQSFNGQPLQLNFPNATELTESLETKTFAHGIAMRGGSRVAFSLAKQYRRLQAAMGFEPLLMVGNVRVKIFGDGRSLLDQVLTAKSDAAPVEIDLEIDGVERLLIEVDYHDGRATGDLIHLCDPKVSK